MKVPFFDYSKFYSHQRDMVLEIFDAVASKGAFIMQGELVEFESELAEFVNAKYALGVGNATDGLELILQSIGLSAGDEVICSTHTMVATASAIHLSGAIPVPVDIRPDGLIDPAAIESAITSRTVGIMPTHLNGRVCDMDKILGICEKHGLFLVEDAAQALGATLNGRAAGTFGVAGAISFYPAKILGCLGDGGAIISNDQNKYETLYQLRDHGRNKTGQITMWGRNSRLDNIQAAILLAQFEKYPSVISRRREIASLYNTLLEDCYPFVTPPPFDSDNGNFDIYQNFEVRVKNRDSLRKYLSDRGVGTLIQWGGQLVHQLPLLDRQYNCPVAEDYFQNCLMLPMNLTLDNEQIAYVCESIRRFYSDGAA